MLNLALPPRWLLGSVAVVTATGLLVVRLGTSTVLRVLWRRGIGVERVLVVGDGIVARAVMQDLIRNGARRGQQLHGCVVDHAPAKSALLLDAGRAVRVPIRGSTHNLDAVLATEQVQHVLVALSAADTSTMQQILSAALRHNVDVHVAPETLGIAAQRITADRRHNQPVLTIQDMAQRQHHRALKRALDICLSLLVLVPWGLLVTAVVAVLIKIDSRGPVFFRQQRLTRTGKPFWVFKFRTMVVNADELKAQLLAHNEASGPIFKMRDDPRLTRVGRWLRRTSLDEVPQVFNILRGDMSWVGPRPPLPAEVDQYEAWQRRRLDITTGLTGLSQISGRSLLAFDDTAKLDLYYIENWSISLDLQILLRTIPAVLTGRGAC